MFPYRNKWREQLEEFVNDERPPRLPDVPVRLPPKFFSGCGSSQGVLCFRDAPCCCATYVVRI